MNFGCIQHSSSKLDSAFICTKFHFYHLSINLSSFLSFPNYVRLPVAFPLSSSLYLAIDLESSSEGRSSNVNSLRKVMMMSFSW